MGQGSFDYVDHEQAKILTELLLKADKMEENAVNVTNSVRHFLKTDQFNIKTGEVSVGAAENLMKSLAAIFNEKRDLLLDMATRIKQFIEELETVQAKVEAAGHASRVAKLKEAITQIDFYLEPIDQLTDGVNSAKKDHLTALKTKILKVERIKHFKNLH